MTSAFGTEMAGMNHGCASKTRPRSAIDAVLVRARGTYGGSGSPAAMTPQSTMPMYVM